MNRLLSLFRLLPHFATADFAVKRVGRSSLYEIGSCMCCVPPGARYDATAAYCALRIGPYSLFAHRVGPLRGFVNPNDAGSGL